MSQYCKLCAVGFPLENGFHIPTQALGMIPVTRCMATPDPARFFCSRCNRGPLFSWEVHDGRCKETCNPATDTRGNIGEPS